MQDDKKSDKISIKMPKALAEAMGKMDLLKKSGKNILFELRGMTRFFRKNGTIPAKNKDGENK